MIRQESVWLVLFMALAGCVVVACGQEPATFNFDDITEHKPFRLNTLPTTPYGPAWADILLRPENFLLCRGASIALCYYSGPGPVTPCVSKEGKGLADCTCYEIPSGAPYFVDINAILNLDVYLATVKTCGAQGENCLPRGTIEAPVCDSINKGTLIPGADLISTFSLALDKVMPISQTTCGTAPYAGCMTAPCKRTDTVDPATNLPLVQCACPLFDGPYQVGQDISQQQCTLGGDSVWSAAFAPLAGGNIFPTTPSCFPDAPGSSGCPLLSPNPPVIPSAPTNINCSKVCAEYKRSNQAGVEVGFTCDATLCTASEQDFDLLPQACGGLANDSIAEILKLELEAGYSCAASQICGCTPNEKTNAEILTLNQLQRDKGVTPQCDLNGTLCGAPR